MELEEEEKHKKPTEAVATLVSAGSSSMTPVVTTAPLHSPADPSRGGPNPYSLYNPINFPLGYGQQGYVFGLGGQPGSPYVFPPAPVGPPLAVGKSHQAPGVVSYQHNDLLYIYFLREL